MGTITEIILMGIWATLFMDIMARIFSKMKIIQPTAEPHIVGRWALYTLRLKFVHDDIYKTSALPHEKLAALVSHYLIGIVLAGIYITIEIYKPLISDQPLVALLFGIITIVLPWLWLFPSIGFGFAASKKKPQSPFIITSLINHTDFGVGMALWIVFFRQFIV